MSARHQEQTTAKILPFVSRAEHAAARLAEVDIDGFLSDRADELVGLGHWCSHKRMEQGGNRSAMIEMVTTPWQEPSPVFGEVDYRNTLALIVSPLVTGEIKLSVQSRQGAIAAESIVPVCLFNEALLAEAFEAFRALAGSKVVKQQA